MGPQGQELVDISDLSPLASSGQFSYASIFFIFERDSASGEGAEREGKERRERGAQNPKQAPGSELLAQSPSCGSNPLTVRSRPERKSDA